MIGRTVSHYRILEKIGQGGMGEVFLADDTSLHRKVALKFLPPEMQQDTAAHKRFLREARSAAALDHPYICHINEAGESEGRDFIAMEYVDGRSVKDKLEKGPLSSGDALPIAIEVAEALEAALSKGIIHRDIKPANIMLTWTGHAKVMDFGLAKQLIQPGGMETGAETVTALTSDWSTVGTLAYISPEQLRSQAIDGRSDIWALGVTLYQMVSGVRPFHGQGGFEITSAIMKVEPRPLPSQVPAELGAVILRCLEKEPGKWYQQAGELREALEAVQAGTVSPWVVWRYRLTHGRWPMIAAAALALPIFAGLLITLDVGGLRSRLAGKMGIPARTVRLAVLPFANVSGAAEQEYLSDGLTTEMIAVLGRLHPETLRVIARTTAMRYKKTDKPIDQIGRELGVDYILEGSAQRESGRIRITADLIKVADQTQLWADRYERELAGILVLQNDVAQQVAKALALKLLPAEQARLASAKTVDPEVYDLYLKGKDYLGRMTSADLNTAEQYFQRALAKDPASAVAYAGMANVWLYRRQIAWAPADETGRKARAAALKAIELDDNLAEAHGTLAGVFAYTDFSFPDAEREFNRTLELDPGNPEAKAGYGHFLMMLRRPDEGIRQIERAVAIDPLQVGNRVLYASDLFVARRYDEALANANEVLRMQPGHPIAWAMVFWSQHLKQRYAEAAVAAAAYYEGVGFKDVAEALKQRYAESGYAAALRLASEVELAKHGDPTAWDAACNYAMVGDRSRALDLLERAYAWRDPNIPFMSCLPIFDPLRTEPRFQALLRKMNLPQ